MSRRPHRKAFGKDFSEGARLLWMRLADAPWDGSQTKLAAHLGVDAGLLSRWLYGDRKPGRTHSVMLETQLGIGASTWDESPSEEFALPATVADDHIEPTDDPDPPTSDSHPPT